MKSSRGERITMFQSFMPSANAGTLRPARELPILDRASGKATSRSWDRKLPQDLKTLARFIGVYCQCKHSTAERRPAEVPGFNVNAIARQPISLCDDCSKLLKHAFVKRSHCPMNPKPACKDCVRHCYHPTYRQQIREVMRFSGMRLLLTGRLDYIFHLLF